MTRKPKRREYTLKDLKNIAEQMGGRIRFDIIPIEMIVPPKPEPAVEEGKP